MKTKYSIGILLFLALTFSLAVPMQTARADFATYNHPDYYYANITNVPDGTFYRQAGFSPDGTKIMAVKQWNDGGIDRWEIVLMNPNGSGETVISPGDSGTGDIAQYTNPFWSDDGSVAGFIEAHKVNPNKVMVYNLSSTNRTYIYEPVAPNDVSNPDFLGSSKANIVFWAYGVGGSVADLFTWDGGTLTNLTSTADYKEYEPVSNADGTSILYWSGETPLTEPVNTTHTLTYSGGIWTKDVVGFTPIADSYWSYWTTSAATQIALTVVSTGDISIYDSTGAFVKDLTGPGYSGGAGAKNFFGSMPLGTSGEYAITSNAGRGVPTSGRDIIIAAPRSTMYVSATGSDSNPGTQVAPFLTFQKGVTEVASGGTVNVAAGIYNVASTITVNKAVTISGPGSGGAIVQGTNPAVVTVFDITASNVTLQNLEITHNALPAKESLHPFTESDALVRLPSGGLSGIAITDNEISVPAQSGAMSTWNGVSILVEDNTAGITITGNTIHNTRNGVVVHYNSTATISNNDIYETKGGIMNYTGSQADANNRTMSNNTWGGAVHNEWDIVWNSGGGPYEPDYHTSVLDLSVANNNGYVLSLMTTGPIGNLTGNRSHIFVDVGTGTLTKHQSNGNHNVPYKTLALGIEAVVPGGTVYVAGGTYREKVVLNKSITLTGDRGDVLVAGPGPGAPILDGDLDNNGTPDQGDGFTIPRNTSLSGITVEGFVIQNFSNGGGGNGVGVGVISWENTSSNVTIRDNLFKNLGYNGVYVGTDTDDMQSNWLIEYNKVEGAPYAGIELTDVTNSQVLHNEITAPSTIFADPGDAGVGIEIAARARVGTVTTSGVLVHGNTISGAFAGGSRAAINLLARAYNLGRTAILSGITVEGNVVSGSGTRGIYMVAESRSGGPSQIDNLAITQNILTGNTAGIEAGGTFTAPKANGTYDIATITVENNKLEGNTTFGLNNLTSVIIDAAPNWWGAASGPGVVGPGTGDKVSTKVTYIPYCTDEPCTTVTSTVTILPGTSAAAIQAVIDAAPPGTVIVLPAETIPVPGGFFITHPGVTIELSPGTVIVPSSPCFTVSADNTTITGGTCTPTGGSSGIIVSGPVSNLVISGVTIDGTGQSTAHGIAVNANVIGLQITDNTIHDMDSDGIHFASGVTASGTIDVHGNRLVNNTGLGINNVSLGSYTAEYNWWGDADGPLGTNGDGVSANVDYDPWCVNEACTGNPPPTPSTFYGYIHFNDGAPSAGDKVDAYLPGVGKAASATIICDPDPCGDLAYQMDVPGDVDGTPAKEGAVDGDTITFKIGTRVVATKVWHSGESTWLDLHPPQALPNGPYKGLAGVSISLNNGTASDYGTDATTYAWDLDNNGTYETPGQIVSNSWPSVGTGTYKVGLKVTDAQGGEGTGTATVNIATITLGDLTGQIYDGSAKAASATTDPTGLTVIFAYTPPAPLAAGSYGVVATIAGYTGSTTGTLVIDPAALSITANDRIKTYGDLVTFAGTEFTTNPITLYNGDTVTSVTLNSDGAAASATVALSPYTITASAAVGSGLSNYTITYYPGSLTVNTKTLDITARNQVKVVGDTFIFLGSEFDAAGLVNGNTVTSVTLTSDGAISTALPGNYDIVPSAALGTGLNNYTIAYHNGTLNVLAKQSLTLVPGWNLVSFNLVPLDTSIATVLTSVAGNYDLVYAWDGTLGSDNWKKYAPSAPPYSNSLSSLNEKMGFWIHMTTGDILDVTGNAPTTTNITLSTAGGGWNLVGYPRVANLNLPLALVDHGVLLANFSLVYAYHAADTADPWKLFDKSAPGFANDLKLLSAGWGYWVKVSVTSTWDVEY